MKRIFLQQEKGQKESANNTTEEIIYDELFMGKLSNQKYGRETFFADSGAT